MSSNVLDFNLEDWQIVQDINVVGNFLGIKEVVPHMKRNGTGSIINISSIAVVGNQGGVPYQASKGATRALTKSVALDLAKDGIRVNSVHPGLITTPMSQNALDDEGRKQMESTIP